MDQVKAKRPALFSRGDYKKKIVGESNTNLTSNPIKNTVILGKERTQAKVSPPDQVPKPSIHNESDKNITGTQKTKMMPNKSLAPKFVAAAGVLFFSIIVVVIIWLLGTGYQEEVIQKSSVFVPFLLPRKK